MLAEFCEPSFEEHVRALTRGLRAKLETLMEALAEQFGTAAEFDDPKGGIYLWVKLPDEVDSLRLAQAALAGGIAINPGPDWTTDKPTAAAACGCASPTPRTRPFARGSPPSPRSVAASSACRRASPLSRAPVRRSGDDRFQWMRQDRHGPPRPTRLTRGKAGCYSTFAALSGGWGNGARQEMACRRDDCWLLRQS